MTNRSYKREYQRLLTKYLEGKCTKEEMEAVDHWYQSFDQNGPKSLDFPDTDNLPELKGEMFENITNGINEQTINGTGAYHQHEPKSVKGISLKHLKRLAVVMVTGIGLAIVVFLQKRIFDNDRQLNSAGVNYERPAEEHPKVIGPATVYLSDGSVVWLNGRSWLEYPEAFTDGVREVTLAGEAFFDVAKDSARPFVIHSSNFTTRVLGTSFNIKDHDHEDSQEVEVVTGKVMVSVKGSAPDSVRELILKPNRKAVYSKKDHSLVESAVEEDIVQKLSINSKLEFNEVPLRDIVKVLNVVHGVSITIVNERMKNCIITADLTNETLEVSVAILSKAINADFTIRGDDIILRGEGCAEAQ